MTIEDFQPTGMGNFLLEGKGFRISFHPHVADGFYGLKMFADDEESETALMPNEGGYLILNGDFRRQYAELADKGYQACLDFYNSQKAERRSSWSTDEI